MGYPDMGAGMYSRLLPYKDWFQFNCAQRVHANSVEHLAWTLPTFIGTAIFFPRTAAVFGTTVLVGRELYRYGYMTDGPTSKVREAGAIPLNIAELLTLLLLGFGVVRYQTGGFIQRRKLYQRLFSSEYKIQLDKIQREADKVTKKTPRCPGDQSEAARTRGH